MTAPRRDVPSPDRAPSHRKPKMPGAGELAAMIQAGESVEDIAAAFGRSPRGIRAALNDGGYTAAGESSHAAPVVEAVEVLRPFDFPSFSDRALCAEADPEAFF